MTVVLAAAILGATTLWVLAPLLGWGGAAEEARRDVAAADREDMLARRREILAAIKDLEMEFHVGKLNREDFEETRERLAREAIEVLRKIDAGSGRSPQGGDSGADAP